MKSVKLSAQQASMSCEQDPKQVYQPHKCSTGYNCQNSNDKQKYIAFDGLIDDSANSVEYFNNRNAKQKFYNQGPTVNSFDEIFHFFLSFFLYSYYITTTTLCQEKNKKMARFLLWFSISFFHRIFTQNNICKRSNARYTTYAQPPTTMTCLFISDKNFFNPSLLKITVAVLSHG